MTSPPAFFEHVRKKASDRWDQLEADPDLAGPWHQLFKQVQSPRHVLSELLQNADDAGATEATVRVENNVFLFEHNGVDFADEHFESLCRFGYSNKRALHTIGFRGIGFKSTFSLGDRVELLTPTLSAYFDKSRFTEPQWIDDAIRRDGQTCVRVAIRDEHRKRELEKNLQEWIKSPVSLLFFNSIRRLRIGESEVQWTALSDGPLSNSHWMSLNGEAESPSLLVKSAPEAFPDEALAEIREERLLAEDEAADFPPSGVEIVMGAGGRLYVVLPTQVRTTLPFACNAPFIQDPARLKIKDPETSPTNRWLLERAGQLAASSMLRLLKRDDLPAPERARAYGLMPDVDRDDSSLEGVCATVVETAFEQAIENQPILLTDSGEIVAASQSVVIPIEVHEIWPSGQASALLDKSSRPSFSKDVSDADIQKLINWRVVEQIPKQEFLGILQRTHLPKPKTWAQIMKLWSYVAPEITGYHRYVYHPETMNIVPVHGRDVLYAGNEVVRLGEKKLLQSDRDWEFLAEHLLVLNQNWTRFLAERRRLGDNDEDVEAAFEVLEEVGLDGTSDTDRVVSSVANEIFSQDDAPLTSCVRLAQIAAKLNADVRDTFEYVSRDGYRRSADEPVLYDETGALEELVPQADRESQLLHEAYGQKFSSCSSEEWRRWASSGRAGLLTFIPLQQSERNIYGRDRVEELVRARGGDREVFFRYVTNQFIVQDWDFDSAYWQYWKKVAVEDTTLWGKIAVGILSQPESHWRPARSARIVQVATTGSTQSVTSDPLLPAWAMKLGELPCLPDTKGFYHKPSHLLRRTPETESLLDVEPFIDGSLDREATRALLDLLGVSSTPTGPSGLLDRLRALSKSSSPPVEEVEKWYRRLDSMIDTCSTEDFHLTADAFRSERLILTADGDWAAASSVFLSANEEDVPGAAVVRPAVQGLTLWPKIGVADRPTADLAIEWLKELPSGEGLPADDARRVRALLPRFPNRIWDKCRHWLNLAGEWVQVEDLAYALTMQSLVQYTHLHSWVREATADFQRLPVDTTSAPPFSVLPSLASRIEDRFHKEPHDSGAPEEKNWLVALATELELVELEDEEETCQVRALASRLAATSWYTTTDLEIIPYIDGTPAGTTRRTDVVWLDRGLYVEDLPKAKLARRVPEEIGRAFDRPDIKAAFDYGYERAPNDIREYMAENFSLAPREVAATASEQMAATSDESPTNGSSTPPSGTDESRTPSATDDGEAVVSEGLDQEREPLGEPLDDESVERTTRATPKPTKPGILERFAAAEGFRRDGDNRFFHPNGDWMSRSPDVRSLWERHDASGDIVRYYWPRDHCLEREPLQIDAEIWSMIETHPDKYSLILSDLDDDPVELSGAKLRSLRERGRLELYPASYRLVVDHDR